MPSHVLNTDHMILNVSNMTRPSESLKNCKWNLSIEWIQLLLFRGESYCWTFKFLIVYDWKREVNCNHSLIKTPHKKNSTVRILSFFGVIKSVFPIHKYNVKNIKWVIFQLYPGENRLHFNNDICLVLD